MNSRRWTSLALFLWAILFFGTAGAQGIDPRRIDPGEPLPFDPGAPAAWQIVTIPGQVAGSTLGPLAVKPDDGTLFVWSMRRELRSPLKLAAGVTADAPRRIDPSEPPFPWEGGFVDPITPQWVTVSTLYELIDGAWIATLVARDQTAASVHVGPGGDVFASTNLPDGSLRVYHKYMTGWMLEVLPAGVQGPVGVFAGDQNVYLRTGNYILRHWMHQWVVEYGCSDFAIGGGLAALGNGQLMAPCESHEHVYDGSLWSTNEQPAMTHVHSLWGARDAGGELHLFAGGSNAAHTEMQMFQFMEGQPGTLHGEFQRAMIPPSGDVSAGYASTVWGRGIHEIYATGNAGGVGRLYHFNGAGWTNAAPEPNLPAMIGIGGSDAGELWVSLADGRLLYRPAPGVVTAGGTKPVIAPAAVAGRTAAASAGVLRAGAPGPRATLELSLLEPRDVVLSFFDLSGRRVDQLQPGRLAAGVHRMTWAAAGLPSGMYFCRLDGDTEGITRKVLIQK